MLKQRIITAAVLILVTLTALFLLPQPFMFLYLLLMVSVAAWEWGNMLSFDASAAKPGVVVVIAVAACMIVLSLLPQQIILYLLMAACLFWLFLFYQLLRRRLSAKSKLLAAVTLLPAAGIALWELYLVSPFIMLAGCLIVWIADTAAYFSGKKFGKTKLAPAISPGKTFEGFYGALAATGVYAVLLNIFALDGKMSLLMFVIAVLLLTAVSVLGDLFESQLKRDAGVKDSSQILPGHGGVFDRIDSLIAVAPFFTLLMLSF